MRKVRITVINMNDSNVYSKSFELEKLLDSNGNFDEELIYKAMEEEFQKDFRAIDCYWIETSQIIIR